MIVDLCVQAASPPEDQALPGKRTALEPRRLDFNYSAEDEGDCIPLLGGTAPATSDTKQTAGDCYEDLKRAPKRPTRGTRRGCA